jgi:hypothetical protein
MNAIKAILFSTFLIVAGCATNTSSVQEEVHSINSLESGTLICKDKNLLRVPYDVWLSNYDENDIEGNDKRFHEANDKMSFHEKCKLVEMADAKPISADPEKESVLVFNTYAFIYILVEHQEEQWYGIMLLNF